MEITNVTSQNVLANGNILFDTTMIPGGCNTFHREGSGLVTLKGSSYCQSRSRFRVFFDANVKGGSAESIVTVQDIVVALAIDEESIPATVMRTSVNTNTQTYHIATMIYIDVPYETNLTLSVKNLSPFSIDVSNANLIVERVPR